MARPKSSLVPRLVNFLRLVWLFTIAWYELGTFYHHTSSCPWPDEPLSHSGTTVARPTHVLLVADPQILDHRSYPDRPPWLMRLSQFIVDLNLRKSWRATLRRRPDAVVFLGDMMDNGRLDMPDEEYNRYVRRFRSIVAADDRLPKYYIPGNHDVGLGSSSPTYRFSEHALERYLSNFGPLNQRISISNHTVLLIDAPGLVDEDRERALAGMSFTQWSEAHPDRTIAFVRSFGQNADPSEGERPILFTHVPLFRPEGTPCGPLRERGTLRQGRGLGYQNLLSEQASQFLLQSIKPAIIFSGDDHDYCEYVHSLPVTDTKRPSPPLSIPELTVKSFSMAMGIRRPGYQLLSLTLPSASPEIQTLAQTPCLLPDQLGIFLSVYIPLVVLTLVVLLVSNIRRSCLRHSSPSSRSAQWTSLDPNDPEETDYDLPPPSAWRSKEFPRPGWSRTCTVDLWGHHRQFTISSAGFLVGLASFFWTGGSAQDDDARRRAGVAKGFLLDVRDVAWAPVLLFIAIAWWVW
ncbi:Metallo-dependent phosphatase [Trametes coccinea BRFM310]|uniref:Metallo-dependent phosphatase n=1 Tax=Trametes coccinea (strain BRFM310) TaxID=1353009 RepID=A0A1Y2ISA5_TRAC3|nr:Metallo-dependent phosphatase [Trametes coccinea BRFM310]